MTIRFIPASEINDPLPISIGLSGGSGTGKTYSALRLARGIAEGLTGEKGRPIGFIDTENRRGLHYREAFPEMLHMDFTATDRDGSVVGFTIDRWLEVVEAAGAAELPAVVIDSFSHAWNGVGGLLEMQETALDRLVKEAEARANGRYAVERDRFNMLAWAEVKPRYRRLIDAIIRAKTNFIICTRAKPIMQKGAGDKARNAFKAKHRREDVPWNPESDSDLMFEMTAMMILDPDRPGCPAYQIKCADQFKALFDPHRPMTEEIGRKMAEWSKGQGEAQRQKAQMDLARDKARLGTADFMAWWNSDEGKAARPAARPIIEELKAICERADHAALSSDDHPFGPPDEVDPSPDEMASAEAKAMAAIRDQQAEAA